MGGRQSSPDMMEVGVEKEAFLVHLWIRCRKLFIPIRTLELGLKRSAP